MRFNFTEQQHRVDVIIKSSETSNDLLRTSERGETSSLLRHSYQQEHVVFRQQISLVEAFFQNMEKRCDWLRISQANLFRFSSGKKESALWDEYI